MFFSNIGASGRTVSSRFDEDLRYESEFGGAARVGDRGLRRSRNRALRNTYAIREDHEENNEDDEEIPLSWHEHHDLLYNTHSLDYIDMDYDYVEADSFKYSAVPIKEDISKQKMFFLENNKKLPINAIEAYNYWDYHNSGKDSDAVLMNETIGENLHTTETESSINNKENNSLNEQNANSKRIIKRQPGDTFSNSLKLCLTNKGKFSQPMINYKFKNNLCDVSKDKPEYMFYATTSEINVLKIQPGCEALDSKPLVKFDTKPDYTYDRDIMSAVWQHFPHSINFLKVTSFLNKEVLIAAVDSGRVLIWYTGDIFSKVTKFMERQRKIERLSGHQKVKMNINWSMNDFKIKPNHQLRTRKSAWGVDTYNEYNLIAVSDNSRRVMLFYYATEHGENRFYTVSTHTLASNIPDISFIKEENDDNISSDAHNFRKDGLSKAESQNSILVYLSAGAIGGELVILKIYLEKIFGPLNRQYSVSGGTGGGRRRDNGSTESGRGGGQAGDRGEDGTSLHDGDDYSTDCDATSPSLQDSIDDDDDDNDNDNNDDDIEIEVDYPLEDDEVEELASENELLIRANRGDLDIIDLVVGDGDNWHEQARPPTRGINSGIRGTRAHRYEESLESDIDGEELPQGDNEEEEEEEEGEEFDNDALVAEQQNDNQHNHNNTNVTTQDGIRQHIHIDNESWDPGNTFRESRLIEHNYNCSKFNRVKFYPPQVISRIELDDNVWSTHFISDKLFKKVSSLKAMTGDEDLDETSILKKISQQSRILDSESDPVYTSDLGLAAKFAHFEVPRLKLDKLIKFMFMPEIAATFIDELENMSSSDPLTSRGLTETRPDHSNSAIASTMISSEPERRNISVNYNSLKKNGMITDTFRRIRKFYDDYYTLRQRNHRKTYLSLNELKYWQPKVTTNFNDKFVIITTDTSLGLFQCNKLVCNASVKNIFKKESMVESLGRSLYDEREFEMSNRISFVKLIPELSCVVVATQSGIASVFRLTSYRGLHGFRQELVFPEPEVFSLHPLQLQLQLQLRHDAGTGGGGAAARMQSIFLNEANNSVKILTGLAVRHIKVSIGEVFVSKYNIYLIYDNGTHLTYQISSDAQDNLVADLII